MTWGMRRHVRCESIVAAWWLAVASTALAAMDRASSPEVLAVQPEPSTQVGAQWSSETPEPEAASGDLSFLLSPDPPVVDVASFSERAQRQFDAADINLTALQWHPDRTDEAVVTLLRVYRQQLLRGRMELARARVLRQPVRPVVARLEQMTAEHGRLLRELLPHLSPSARAAARHTLYTIRQTHRSAEASLNQPSQPGQATAAHGRRVVNLADAIRWGASPVAPSEVAATAQSPIAAVESDVARPASRPQQP